MHTWLSSHIVFEKTAWREARLAQGSLPNWQICLEALCLCREGRSYLVGPDYLASHNLLSCLVLRPGLALPGAPAGLSVLESLRDKHILKSDTGTLKTLGEASRPSLQLRSCLDGVCGAVLFGKRPASIQARNTRGFEPYIQVQWGYLAQPCQREQLVFSYFHPIIQTEAWKEATKQALEDEPVRVTAPGQKQTNQKQK